MCLRLTSFVLELFVQMNGLLQVRPGGLVTAQPGICIGEADVADRLPVQVA